MRGSRREGRHHADPGDKPFLSEIGCGHTQDGGDHGRSKAGDAISPDTFFIFGLPIRIVAHLLVEAVSIYHGIVSGNGGRRASPLLGTGSGSGVRPARSACSLSPLRTDSLLLVSKIYWRQSAD